MIFKFLLSGLKIGKSFVMLTPLSVEHERVNPLHIENLYLDLTAIPIEAE
jgi:hypothetical protein